MACGLLAGQRHPVFEPIGSVENLDVLGRLARRVLYTSFHQQKRRAHSDLEPRSNQAVRQRCRDRLLGCADDHAGTFDQIDDRRRRKVLRAVGATDPFRHIGRRLRERLAVEAANANGALRARVRLEFEARPNEIRSRHIAELDDLDRRLAADRRQVFQQTVDARGNRLRAQQRCRPIGHRRAAAAHPLHQAFGGEFIEGALGGDTADAEGLGQLEFARQDRAFRIGPAGDAVTQDDVKPMVQRHRRPFGKRRHRGKVGRRFGLARLHAWSWLLRKETVAPQKTGCYSFISLRSARSSGHGRAGCDRCVEARHIFRDGAFEVRATDLASEAMGK